MTCGTKLCFHGAFKNKADAGRKADSVGGRVLKRRVKGRERFIVATDRDGSGSDVVRFKGCTTGRFKRD